MAVPKILLLGDSLTQLGWGGWAAHIADVYQRRADVVNRGMAGYNTRWYLEYAGKGDIWTMTNVKMIILFFGANDASDLVLNPRQHVPEDEYVCNMERLIELAEEHHGKDVAIVVVSAPPVVHQQRLEFQVAKYKEKATGKLERNLTLSNKYAELARSVAEKRGRPFVNLWKGMQESPDWESYFWDGLHFTNSGSAYVSKVILQTIAEHYPALSVTPCPFSKLWGNSGSRCEGLLKDGPWHDEIDYRNHKDAF